MVNCWMKGQAGQNKCKMMVRFVNIGGNKLTMAPEKRTHTLKGTLRTPSLPRRRRPVAQIAAE